MAFEILALYLFFVDVSASVPVEECGREVDHAGIS